MNIFLLIFTIYKKMIIRMFCHLIIIFKPVFFEEKQKFP